MVISLFIDPMNSRHHNDKDNREIQGKMIHEGDDLHQVTTPPKTTNSITRMPHLIWVMGELSFSLLFSHSLVLHYSNRNPYYFCKTCVLGGPGSSKSALVDNILDKECFYHVNVGTLLFEELKNPIVNDSKLPSDKGRKGRQKVLNAWQNGELLDSVRARQSYYICIIYEKKYADTIIYFHDIYNYV